jgi:plastocyanin
MRRPRALRIAMLVVAMISLCVVSRGGRAGDLHAQAQTAAQGPQQWQVQVDDISPAGHNWSFNAYYPDHLQAHAGDTVTFTVAQNQNAFHTVALEAQTFIPDQGYPGFVFPDEDDDPAPLETVYFNSKPLFGA